MTSPTRFPDGQSRRDILRLAGAAGAATITGLPVPAQAEDKVWRHAVSLMGTPRYPAGFTHFEHVNPGAPKAGLLRLGAQGTFDNFNPFVEGVKGELENGIETLLHDTLLVASEDEVATEYGLIAEAVSYPADFGSVTYRLRPEARFQDGSPITPADVIFTFETLKGTRPTYAFYYHNVQKAEQTGPHEVTFTFSEKGNRELPQIVGQMPVLPKAWWTGTAPGGERRDPKSTTLEPPLGSGRYRLKSFDPGRFALYELAPDYWARDLNVNVGRHNFREIRFEYFRDSTVLLEAFKADRLDFRSENSARNWATAYEFPAVAEGRVVKEEFPIRSMGVMQAFVFNLRRPRFADPRVRRAFNLAFDFEDTNRTLFYGLYQRIDSYFFGTELASSGLPEGQEREILDSVKDKVPGAVFTTPYRNPVNGTPDAVRANLREAVRLLAEAGYELRGRQLVDKRTGEPFRVEFLGFDQNTERFVLPYRAALERIGIAVDLRIVDAAQYQNRLRSFDFDITTSVWAQSLSPGNEQREYWGSAAADRPGSRNLAGIKDAGIDALIERVIYAKDRPELVAATRALDRVLLAHDFVVPQWSSRVVRTARWNRFGRPNRLPEYGGSGFPTVWWYDEALVARTGAPR
ncbi:extracellular solute-binding protein [Enterovirga aerilata]|uniref:ABC transporter substrate-binding protein n=1 Tax=Enterovirga aerilata TaxID=2730920 RepID=A0A849I0G0_9HYPH|nr:extracellular solute-binding protein [Enterovirga sp. DB1703]NNM70798.1 ABC transporter substrate-binding protein [Enterovirga sp. DB1703]